MNSQTMGMFMLSLKLYDIFKIKPVLKTVIFKFSVYRKCNCSNCYTVPKDISARDMNFQEFYL